MQEVIVWVWGSVREVNAIEQHTWALGVFIRTLLQESMAFGHANLETSCLLMHVLVACTLVELHRAFQRRKPQRWACREAMVLSVGWFRLILDTSLIILLRGMCSGLGLSEGGIVYGLFSKEALHIGKAHCTSHRTHPVPVPSWSQRCKHTPESTSQAQIVGSSLLSVGALSYDLSNFGSGGAGTIDGVCEGRRRRAALAAQGRRCQSSVSSAETVELAAPAWAAVEKYLGLFRSQRSSFKLDIPFSPL